jgi:hypothetical protein
VIDDAHDMPGLGQRLFDHAGHDIIIFNVDYPRHAPPFLTLHR